jgi:hypothetical protein
MKSASRLVLAAIVALSVTVSNSASAQISQTRHAFGSTAVWAMGASAARIATAARVR